MAEETITTSPSQGHTTIIRERGSSGTGIVVAIVLLIAVIAGLYVFSQSSNSEVAKNNAITQAANNVSSAASKVGDAADNAANKATN